MPHLIPRDVDQICPWQIKLEVTPQKVNFFEWEDAQYIVFTLPSEVRIANDCQTRVGDLVVDNGDRRN